MRRALITVLLVTASLLVAGPAGPAGALQTTTVFDEAADELRNDAVFVHPDAERAIDDDAAQALEDQIAGSGQPVFVAVLPGSAVDAAGGPEALPGALAEATGLTGTYAVVAGDYFRAGSDAVPDEQAAAAATAAFQASGDESTEAVLTDFVDRMADVGTGGGGSGDGGVLVPGPGEAAPETGTGEEATGEESGGGGISDLTLLALLVAGGGGFFLWTRARRRREEAEVRREVDADRQLLLAEISVLGDDVMALEHQVTLHPEARADYDAAVSRFRAAHAALDYAKDEIDLVRVQRVVVEGQYAMARAKAHVEGRPVPAPPAELTRPGRHDEPALDLDEYGQPVYVGYGGPFYGGGWFGGGGGMLSGLLLGSMLSPWGWGGGMMGGWGDGGDGGGDGGGWSDGGGGWGDVGGGDWGGGFGDIGGGDWG